MRLYERDGMTHAEWVDEAGERVRRSLNIPWRSPPEVVAKRLGEVFSSAAQQQSTPALVVVYTRALATYYRNHRDLRGVESKWENDIKPFFDGGNTPVGDITEDRLDSFVAYLFDKGNHPKTVNRKVMGVSKLLHLAALWKLIGAAPRIPLQPESEGRLRWLSDAEEATAVAYLRAGAGGGGRGNKPNGVDPTAEKRHAAEFADAVECLIDTGFRLGEILRIEDRFIDWSSTPARVHLPGAITKSKKPRTVGLTQRAARHFATRLRRDTDRDSKLRGSSRPFGLLTQDRCGDLWEATRAAMGLAADPEFVIHALRHTFAVRMLEGGVDIRVVQYLLGHAKPDTTAIYAHVSPRLSKGAVDALEARTKDVTVAVPALAVVNGPGDRSAGTTTTCRSEPRYGGINSPSLYQLSYRGINDLEEKSDASLCARDKHVPK